MYCIRRRVFLFATVFFVTAGLLSSAAEAGPMPPSRGKRKTAPKKPADDAQIGGFPQAPDKVLPFAVDQESKRNEVVFTSTAPKETIKGVTAQVKGTLTLNPKQLNEVTGRFSVAWKDIDTGNPTRNEHLQSAPWVDAKSHPEIVFVVTGFELNKKQSASRKTIKGELMGEMSMNGKAKEMKIRAILAYVQPKKKKKGREIKEGIGIRSRFDIELEDFGIKGRGVGQAVAAKQKLKVRLFLSRADSGDEATTGEDSTAENKGKNKLAL